MVNVIKIQIILLKNFKFNVEKIVSFIIKSKSFIKNGIFILIHNSNWLNNLTDWSFSSTILLFYVIYH